MVLPLEEEAEQVVTELFVQLILEFFQEHLFQFKLEVAEQLQPLVQQITEEIKEHLQFLVQ